NPGNLFYRRRINSPFPLPPLRGNGKAGPYKPTMDREVLIKRSVPFLVKRIIQDENGFIFREHIKALPPFPTLRFPRIRSERHFQPSKRGRGCEPLPHELRRTSGTARCRRRSAHDETQTQPRSATGP